MVGTQIRLFSPILKFVFGPVTCFESIDSSFKQFVANLEEEIGYESYAKNDIVQQLYVPCVAIELSKDETSLVIKDMLDSSNGPLKSKALDRYRSIGEKLYLEARQMDEKIKCFETKIQRQYFDVTPLDDDQLYNWHLYLDFVEKQDNLDWVSISCIIMLSYGLPY